MVLRSRPTIGLFAPSTSFPWAMKQWEGVVRAAKELEVNLVSFSGGVLGCQPYGGSANVLYDLAAPDRLDGLIVWSTAIGWNISREALMGFFNRFGSLPKVSLEMALPGIPSILMNDYQGMHAVVTHLVEHHGYRRIAFLPGPAGHEGGRERLRAYRDVLTHHGLPLDPSLLPPPDMVWDDPGVLGAVLDANKVPLDAVVGFDDELMLSALTLLKARGLKVPRDLAMAGFDNLDEGTSVTPPLTSADPPFFKMSRRAVELVLAQLEGKSVPELERLPVRLVVRQSCGCGSPVLHDAAVEAQSFSSVADRQILNPKEAPIEQPRWEQIRAALSVVGGWDAGQLSGLWKAFVEEIQGRSVSRFLELLNHQLVQTVEASGDAFAWLPALATLQRTASPWVESQPLLVRLKADALWRQGQALAAEVAQRSQARRNFVLSAQQGALRSIGEALLTTFDTDALMNVVATELPRLGIASCFLSLYTRPDNPVGDARLLLAYDAQGRRPLPPEGLIFPATQLVPTEFWSDASVSTRIVLALYFQSESLGFVVFDLDTGGDVAVCEPLRWQLSSALKGASLIRTERNFFHSQKLGSLGMLAGGIAHDFNNILTIILTNTELAEMKLPTDSPALPKLATIKKATLRATDLARQMLAYSGKGVFHVEALDLGELLGDMDDLLRASVSKNVTLSVDLGPVPPVMGDATQLRQVVMNLVINASEAIGDLPGHIGLQTRATPAGVFLEVTDDGCGMDTQAQARIFDPFFTTRFAGRGLGLSVVQGIVRGHGGEIDVKSAPGRGSTFVVRLPAVERNSGVSAPPLARTSEPWTGSGTALFVDDEEALRTAGSEILSSLGYRVLLASSGEQALVVVRSTPVDLVILDLTMPGMGGQACFLELRRLRPDLKVLLSSGYNERESTETLLDRGLAGFVPKPYTVEQVTAELRRLNP